MNYHCLVISAILLAGYVLVDAEEIDHEINGVNMNEILRKVTCNEDMTGNVNDCLLNALIKFPTKNTKNTCCTTWVMFDCFKRFANNVSCTEDQVKEINRDIDERIKTTNLTLSCAVFPYGSDVCKRNYTDEKGSDVETYGVNMDEILLNVTCNQNMTDHANDCMAKALIAIPDFNAAAHEENEHIKSTCCTTWVMFDCIKDAANYNCTEHQGIEIIKNIDERIKKVNSPESCTGFAYKSNECLPKSGSKFSQFITGFIELCAKVFK